MPSSTFLNLPEEKRVKFLAAARAEFARAPYAEASINKIIHAADIPRGSFYMYFKDKEELFLYLMDEYVSQLTALLERLLEERRGDPFAAFLDLFDYIQADYRRPDRRPDYEHVIQMLRRNASLQSGTLPAMGRCRFPGDRLVEFLDPRALDLRRSGDLEDMLHLLLGITFQAVVKGILSDDPAPVREHFFSTLDILRRGMAKKPAASDGIH